MEQSQVDAVQGWFAGRLPEGWFTGTEVTIEDDQIVVMGTLPEMDVIPGATPDFVESAAAGRIARFREQTRGQRIGMAREAEARFGRFVTWGARLGGVTKRFTPGGSGWQGGRGGWGHGWGRRGPGWRHSGGASSSEPDVQTF
jgi:hypothetical protein